MPNSQLKYKAGKLYFLLVCLCLFTSCGQKKAVFYAGTESQNVSLPKETKVLNENTSLTEETKVLEEPEESGVVEKEVSKTELININTASAAELMMLPGIGEVRAAAIIEYRQQIGDFQKIEDIMNVKGIKTGIFSKINSLICVK